MAKYFFYKCIYINMNNIRWFYVMMRCHEDTVMLRSTMGSYGRPVIEVAFRETVIHSTKVVWEILAQEEWLGYRHDTSPMVDIPGWTLVWAHYMVFFDFTIIKVYMYYVLKIYSIVKETLVVSDVVLAQKCSENIFDRPWCI